MKYYLTTPIYYANGAPHIGHTYSTVVADAIRRFKRMQGYEAVLTTGTDEHGQKVERAAKAAGKTAQEFVDIHAGEFRRQWDRLAIQYDRFVRTTDAKHHQTVQDLFRRCHERGYIYLASYTGQYCTFCELYVSDAKTGDPCPDCGRPTETVTEQNYFFKLAAFQERLLELYRREPQFVRPETRRNEVISFVSQGLNDLSITRTTLQWGIPVPGESQHVFYVWFDALSAYMTGARDGNLWPADLHLIGKEIVRFHAVYWPAFLMAAELPLPKRIFAHGWLLFEQDKMSKSKGNVVKPEPIRQVAGADALRYFLMREIVFGQDGSFSYDALVGRYNADLANGLGNLVSRTLTMINRYCGGVVPSPAEGLDFEIGKRARAVVAEATDCFENFEFSRCLESVWSLQAAVDKYIVEHKPWDLAAQGDAGRARLEQVLGTAAETLRVATVLLYPMLPESCEKIWAQLGRTEPLASQRLDQLEWGQAAGGRRIGAIEAVFPRLDKTEAIGRMRELEEQVNREQAALLGKKVEGPAGAAPAADGRITIDDFARVDLRVGVVKSAERVKGADKLLHLMVDIGEPEPRSIVAGIAQSYAPEQMTGRKVVIVANLQPRKLRGIESNGMIVAASLEGGQPVLAGFLEEVPVGARLK
jgi:methionyl-tRNA synthetase